MGTITRRYRISEVLETTGISRRTLRVYEEVGLIERTTGEAEPEYGEDVLDTLLRIQRLRRDLGVNLAGVQVILEMRRKIEELQRNLEEVVTFVQTDLRESLEDFVRQQERAIVPRPLARPPKMRED